MLNISKGAEPEFFYEFKHQHQLRSWDDLKPVATQLRKHILEREQTVSETALCIYCERRVTLESSHIDHIRPKDPGGRYAHLFAEYKNLAVSCCSNSSCGHKKGNDYRDDFINPVEDNPAEYMTYETMTGRIVPVNDATKERVESTCEMLGLNSCYELLRARVCVLLSLNAHRRHGVIDSYIDTFKEFPTLIDFYKQEHLHRDPRV